MTREEKVKAISALKKSVPIMAVTQEEFSEYIQTLNKVMDWLEQEQKTNWIPCSVRTPETDDLYYVTEKINDDIGCTTEEWRDGRWVNLAEWEKVIAWMPIPDAYEESEINDERK